MKKTRRFLVLPVAVPLLLFTGMMTTGSVNVCFASVVPAETEESGPAGHGHTEGEKPTLNPMRTLPTNSIRQNLALWTIVVFGGLVLIVGKFGFKPIAKALDEREKQIADNIAGAEHANQEAKELLKQYQTKLAEAESEVKAIVDAGKQEAARAGDVIVAKAKEAAEAERIRAAREIEAATDGALQELADRSADLAVSLAGKILHEKLNRESHADLVRNAVSDFSRN
ncbi:MAG: F0F1 ATP synthase subunit B [Planctomycetaceae bacterium]|nr:F0F1 ATP synthase subunit B [Planctomycetaceae bacterium]